MMGWYYGWGWMLMGGFMMVLFWVALIVLIVWAVRSIPRSDGRAPRDQGSAAAQSPNQTPQQTPLEILQTRYAKGEITRDEYETIRRDLQAS